MIKKWIVAEKKSDDIAEQLLINRKIKKEDWASFLKPDFERDLYDPFLMKNMQKAVKRISEALENKEKIGIFGDYDADGIPGTVLMFEAFKKLGITAKTFIPSRDQGYGLNKIGIDGFAKDSVTLLITIDLGVRNTQEIEYAKSLGMDTIIIDHHEVGSELPKVIIIDPKQTGDKYPFKELAATGVVFKVLQALSKSEKKITISFLKWSLDLVGISTICDIVPLISENRIFAKYGIIVLRKTKRLGLKEMYIRSAIDPAKIGTYAVGFQIGPRLNAPGRMEHAQDSFNLLIANKKDEAREIAARLDKVNKTRQEELERVLGEAKEKVCTEKLNQKKVIVVAGENWPHGIIGLVAGRLMEEYARPVIVCEKKGSYLRGSARSVEGFDIIEALQESKKYLEKYGGHKKAAGLTLESSHLKFLYEKLLKIAQAKLKADDLVPKIKIDMNLADIEINLKLFDIISKFEPFGMGNPRPVFLLENAKVANLKTVGGENQHLKLLVNNIKSIGFDLGKKLETLNVKNSETQKADVVFTIDEDNWDSQRKIQLKILDIKFI